MRLAGTWKQYSKKAISQLTAMAFQSGEPGCLRWPYQANVMKTLETVRRAMVLIARDSTNSARGEAAVEDLLEFGGTQDLDDAAARADEALLLVGRQGADRRFPGQARQ